MYLDELPLEQAEHWLVTWGFGGADFEALRAHAEEVYFPARANIFSQGDAADGMYLVMKGMALVFVTDAAGNEHTVGIVTEGQSFGELGLLIGQPRLATVAAGLDVELLKITPGTLAKLEQEQPELIMQMYKALAQTFAEQWLRVGPWIIQQRKAGHQ